jgi:hypothetical protein
MTGGTALPAPLTQRKLDAVAYVRPDLLEEIRGPLRSLPSGFKKTKLMTAFCSLHFPGSTLVGSCCTTRASVLAYTSIPRFASRIECRHLRLASFLRSRDSLAQLQMRCALCVTCGNEPTTSVEARGKRG